MSLPGGTKNSEEIINFMKCLESSNDKPDYDSIHSYYGIIDDDNHRLKKNSENSKNRQSKKNLFAFNRYAKENYALDPINIYFYLRDLKDIERNQNENIEKLWQNINVKIDGSPLDFLPLKKFNLREIYQELKDPKKSENIKNFLQMIIYKVKDKVFDILFKSEENFHIFINSNEILKMDNWITKIIKPLADYKLANTVDWEYKRIFEELKSNMSKKDKDESEKIKENKHWYDILKDISEKEDKNNVKILGIELTYPMFFTCLKGHFLDDVLKHMFAKTISCDKIIEKFQQTGTGIFIPDEIINMYRTLCHNIIYDKNVIKLVKEKYRNTSIFILYNSNNCEEFKR